MGISPNKAKFLGVEIDDSLRFKNHIQDLSQRAEKRLNILRILAWGGFEPRILIRLYKVYIHGLLLDYVEWGSKRICADICLDNNAIQLFAEKPPFFRVTRDKFFFIFSSHGHKCVRVHV